VEGALKTISPDPYFHPEINSSPPTLLLLCHIVGGRVASPPTFTSQAVEEVLETMEPVFEKHPEMVEVMERLVEPERMIAFRVAWVDDDGKQQVRPRVGTRFRVRVRRRVSRCAALRST